MAAPDFVKTLPATEEEARKLQSFGAESPEALLAMITAGRDAFDAFMGRDPANRIVRALRAMVPPGSDSRRRLRDPPGGLGASLQPPPKAPAPPAFDIARRDRIFEHLQHLRRSGAPAEEVSRVEQELDALLRGPSSGRATQP